MPVAIESELQSWSDAKIRQAIQAYRRIGRDARIFEQELRRRRMEQTTQAAALDKITAEAASARYDLDETRRQQQIGDTNLQRARLGLQTDQAEFARIPIEHQQKDEAHNVSMKTKRGTLRDQRRERRADRKAKQEADRLKAEGKHPDQIERRDRAASDWATQLDKASRRNRARINTLMGERQFWREQLGLAQDQLGGGTSDQRGTADLLEQGQSLAPGTPQHDRVIAQINEANKELQRIDAELPGLRAESQQLEAKLAEHRQGLYETSQFSSPAPMSPGAGSPSVAAPPPAPGSFPRSVPTPTAVPTSQPAAGMPEPTTQPAGGLPPAYQAKIQRLIALAREGNAAAQAALSRWGIGY